MQQLFTIHFLENNSAMAELHSWQSIFSGLTSFLCEFWHYFKKPSPDTGTLCTWETMHLNVLVLMAH
jgi:hypothetical protein